MSNLISRYLTRRRLAKIMRPDPGYRDRRLAQFTPERRERYLTNIAKIGGNAK